MKYHRFIKILSSYRHPKGATMALVAACIVVLLVIAVAFFYIVETYSGDKQLCNSADAGALAAAHQIIGVSITMYLLNS